MDSGTLSRNLGPRVGWGKRIRQIEERMRPGALSDAGFLGKRESLRARLRTDSAQLRRLRIRPQQIADRLETLVAKADRILELRWDETGPRELHDLEAADLADDSESALVEGEWLVSRSDWMGYQECPFLRRDLSECDDGLERADTHYVVEHASRGEIAFPGLMIHLARDHRFFEGETTYRVDPIAAVRMLDLQPGVDYRPTWSTEYIWCSQSGSSRPDDWTILEGRAIAAAARRGPWAPVAQGVEAFVLGSEMVLRIRETGRPPGPIEVNGHRVRFPDTGGLSHWVLTEQRFVAP